jgi:DNA-binding NtrC family response regulator
MGSIFLDEIGEISQSVQIKILRVLQDKKFERVGGEETLEVDTRIISATNKDLKAEIEKGTFREDLFYRLNVVNIDIPPLRERKEDIDLLVAAFIKEFAQENNKPVEAINQKARTMLHNYSWPGNVRELRNSIESAVVMCKGTVITPDDLPPGIARDAESDDIRISVGSTLAEAEREVIRSTLNANNGNKSRTAEVLGIGRKTLHRKIADYHLDDGRRVAASEGHEAGTEAGESGTAESAGDGGGRSQPPAV